HVGVLTIRTSPCICDSPSNRTEAVLSRETDPRPDLSSLYASDSALYPAPSQHARPGQRGERQQDATEPRRRTPDGATAIAQTSRGARSTLLSDKLQPTSMYLIDKTVRRAEAGVPKMVEEVAPFRSTGFTDPGWEHGVAQDEKRKKVKCNYCGKIVSGGIYRLKQHLARISGEVTYCKKASEEVFMKMKENLEGYRSNRKRHLEDEEQSFDLHSNHDDEEEEELDYKQKGREARIARSLVTSITPLRSLGYIDPGWEHGVAQDEKKKKVKCNYCEKIVSGGINRFKQHLARIPGEVASCKMAPEEVYLKMKENMKWHRTGRRRRPETKEVAALYMHPENEDENEHANDTIKAICTVDDHDVSTSKTIRKRSRGRSPGNGTRGAELQLKQIALDSVLSNTRKIHYPLSYKLLKQKRRSIRRSRKEVLSAICRFFYYAAIPFNAADSPYFHKMLDLVSQYGHGFKSPTSRLISGRSLQDEVQTTKEYFVEIKASWATTGCSILADSWRDVQGKTIINFLVSCPRGTYFISSVDASDVVKDATCLFNFLTLRCLQDHRSALKRMFHSSRWISSQLAKSDEGKEVENIIFNSTFWKKTHYVNKSVDPVVQMLTEVGSNCTLSMPSIYYGIYSSKLAMKAVHADNEQKYGPFWSVLDNHWNSVFHHPLYVAAYFLNPSYRYRPDFMAIPEVIRGLNECITRLEPDTGRRISAVAQISDFVYGKADFGTELALSTRIDLDPAAWWQQHGINCLELQRIAVCILSQSCTSFGCKPNWSTFDHTHAMRHSCLAQKRLNDFAYVHYNLRLRERERQLKRITDESISFDNVFLERLLDNWIVSIDQPALLDDEEALYHNAEQAESYGIEINETEEFNGGSKKTSTDIALPELLETSGAHSAGAGAAIDEDDTDLDFLDDDLDD
ncbi:hypothetical protein MUK42_32539, partial [Musa troglodytarum]